MNRTAGSQPFTPNAEAKGLAARLRALNTNIPPRPLSPTKSPARASLQKISEGKDLSDNDLRLVIREHALASEVLRRHSGKPGLSGFRAAWALLRETVKSTSWICAFDVDTFRWSAAIMPRFPVLVYPSERPKMAVQAEAQIARIHRTVVPTAANGKRSKSDDFATVAADCVFVLSEVGIELGTVDEKEWSASRKQLRNELIPLIVTPATLEELSRQVHRVEESKRTDRVKETILARMAAMLGLGRKKKRAKGA